jgi:fibronectin type 3 domain-containing protein
MVVKAQQIQLYAGNSSAKKAVELKWLGKELKRDDSYDIYRKQTGGDWQKMNTTPIKRATPLDINGINAEAAKPNKNIFLLTYSQAFQKSTSGDNIPGLGYYVLYLVAPVQNELAALMGIYYVDETAVAGTSYEYCLTKDGKKPQAALSNVSITAAAYVQPAAPAGFAAKANDKQVELKWGADKKYSQYRIYRSLVAKGKPQDTLTIMLSDDQQKLAAKNEFFYSDKDSLIQNGKTYYYKICGVDFFGNETKLSTEITATPEDMTPPNAVYGFKTQLKDKTVKLSWWKSKDADCAGYNLYKSQNEKSGFVKLNATLIAKTDTVYSDKRVKEGEQYFYYLEAVDKKGNGAKTETVSYVIPDMTPPAVPKNLSARTDTGKIYLKWDKNTEADLAGYYVFRALDKEPTNFQLLNPKPIAKNSFMDTLPKEANNYFLYRICAADKNYNRSAQTAFIAARMPDVVPPTAVILKSAEIADGKVKLQWTPNRDRDFKGYEVWRAEADTGNNAINPQKITTTLLAAKTTLYTDDKATTAKNWQYYVVCVDSAGNRSLASNKVTVPVTSALAKTVTIKAAYSASAKAVSLSWTAAAKDLGYKVYRKKEGGNYLPITNIAKATAYTDKGIEEGKTYSYKVLIIAPDGDDVYSNEVKVKAK